MTTAIPGMTGSTDKFVPIDYDPFAGAAIARAVPTTEAQRELWLADQFGREASLAYNESISLHLTGALQALSLQGALDALVERHDALRSTISADGLNLLVAPHGSLQAQMVDLSALNVEAQAQATTRLRVEAVETPFDLLNGPLIRATLARLAETEHELILTAHHIVCDGWSFGLISTELMALYASTSIIEGARSLAPAYSFADHAMVQADAAHYAAAETDTRWWVRLYDDTVPALELPTDRPRKAVRAFTSRREDLIVEPALAEAVRKLGARHGSSLFVTLFAAFGAMLARLCGQEEVVVGVPAAGQPAEGKHTLVGHCVQLLPIRLAADLEQPFDKFLDGTRGRVLDA